MPNSLASLQEDEAKMKNPRHRSVFGRVCYHKAVLASANVAMLLLIAGCAHRQSLPSGGFQSLLSVELQQQIREVMDSVVEVVCVREYRIERFHYEEQNGRFIPDPTSPVGYRLRGGSALQGITFDKKLNQAFGAGLLLMHDERRALILTSDHLVSLNDTLLTYYRSARNDTASSHGEQRTALFSRAIAIRSELSVRSSNQLLYQARVVAEDKRYDLALIATTWRPGMAVPYARGFSYTQPARVAELAVAVGYPEEIKQVTFGMVSAAPYPGNFSIGIVARFGFSGCPVFTIREGAGLALAGLGRGAPVSEAVTIVPPADFVSGYYLQPEDVSQLRVERAQQINPGLLYCVDLQRIGDFIRANLGKLDQQYFRLPSRFLPPQ
jgi:hypothetical protein